MITILCRTLRRLAAISTGILLLSIGDNCFAQELEPAPSDIGIIYNTLLQDDLNIISPSPPDIRSGREEVQMLPPGTNQIQSLIGSRRRDPQQRSNPQGPDSPTTYFRAQLSEQIDFLAKQGNDVQQLREMVERVLSALEANKPAARRDIDVAGFEVVDKANDRPGAVMPDGVVHLADSLVSPHKVPEPQLRQLEALKESAKSLQRAGLPEIAKELHARAEHLEREIKEDHERKQQQRQRAEAEMRERSRHRQFEQRPQGLGRGDAPAPPMRELHEQLEALRREMRSIDEKVTHLTEMIETHHRTAGHRGHHEDMDDDDECDDDDCDHDDCDDDHKSEHHHSKDHQNGNDEE